MKMKFSIEVVCQDGRIIHERSESTNWSEVYEEAKKNAPCIIRQYEEDGVCYHPIIIEKKKD